MKTIVVPNPGATLALGAFFLVANVANGLYSARSVEPSGAFGALWYLGAAGVITYWVHADCRRLGVREPLDLGLFVLLVWPLALPYHLLKTRGSRGLLTLAGLLVLFVATYLMGVLVFYAAQTSDVGR